MGSLTKSGKSRPFPDVCYGLASSLVIGLLVGVLSTYVLVVAFPALPSWAFTFIVGGVTGGTTAYFIRNAQGYEPRLVRNRDGRN